VDAKYRLLEELGQDYGRNPPNSPIELKRARALYEQIADQIDIGDVKNVLDYGGGDGRLMQDFVRVGKSCFNIDYNRNSVTGVEKLGDTLDSLEPARQFDLIICSHVLEHVAEPLAVVKELSQHLTGNGWIYIEVPMEVWKAPPLHPEPVTHINFFTPNSLRNLLTLAGLSVSESRLGAYLHPLGTWVHVVRAIARRDRAQVSQILPRLRPPEAPQLLQPGLATYGRYIWANPRMLLYTFRDRFALAYKILCRALRISNRG